MSAVLCESPPFGIVILFSKEGPDGRKVWEAPEAGWNEIWHFAVIEGCTEGALLKQATWLLEEANKKALKMLYVLVHKNTPEYVANVGNFLSALASSFKGEVIAAVTCPEVPSDLRRLVPPVVRLLKYRRVVAELEKLKAEGGDI